MTRWVGPCHNADESHAWSISSSSEPLIERVKTTSMEKVVHGYMGKVKDYLRRENKVKKKWNIGICVHIVMYVHLYILNLRYKAVKTNTSAGSLLRYGHGIGRTRPFWSFLTHWDRVTHICVGKLSTIGSDNGLSPGWHQAVIWTSARLLLIWPLETNFNVFCTYWVI